MVTHCLKYKKNVINAKLWYKNMKKLIQFGKSVLVWVEIKFLVEMPDFIRK